MREPHVSLHLRDMGLLTSSREADLVARAVLAKLGRTTGCSAYLLNIFLIAFSKIFIPKGLGAREYGACPQNLGPKGLAAKILRNKDLADEMEPFRGHPVTNRLE